MLEAVIFDFDGLVLDTEVPLFRAWHEIYLDHGATPITLEEWSASIGLADGDPARLDPWRRLTDAIAIELAEQAVQEARRRRRDDLIDAEQLRPGVLALLDQAQSLGLPVGIASSSPLSWLEHHLGRRGVLDRFDVVSCAGELPGKPDPAVYLHAARKLGVGPTRVLALEDSPVGVRAAKAAGMTCVAVPCGITAHLDLSHADRVVASLEQVDLVEWATRVG